MISYETYRVIPNVATASVVSGTTFQSYSTNFGASSYTQTGSSVNGDTASKAEQGFTSNPLLFFGVATIIYNISNYAASDDSSYYTLGTTSYQSFLVDSTGVSTVASVYSVTSGQTLLSSVFNYTQATTTGENSNATLYHTTTTEVDSTITVPTLTTSSYTVIAGTITQTSTSTYSESIAFASSGTSTTQGDSYYATGIFVTNSTAASSFSYATSDQVVSDTIWIAESSDVIANISQDSWMVASDAATTTQATISASTEWTTVSNYDSSVTTATGFNPASTLTIISLQFASSVSTIGIATVSQSAMTDRFPMDTFSASSTTTIAALNTSASFSTTETISLSYGVSYSTTSSNASSSFTGVCIPTLSSAIFVAGTLNAFSVAASTFVADMPLSQNAGMWGESVTQAALAITGSFPFTIFDFPYSSNSTAELAVLPYGVFKTTVSQSTTGTAQSDTVTVPASQQTLVTGSYVSANALALTWITPGASDVSTGTASWTTATGIPYSFSDAQSIIGGGGITPNNTTTEFRCGGAYLYTYGNSTETSSSSYSLTDPASATSSTGIAQSVSVVLNVPIYQGTGVFAFPYPMGVYDTAHPSI